MFIKIKFFLLIFIFSRFAIRCPSNGSQTGGKPPSAVYLRLYCIAGGWVGWVGYENG